MKKVLILSGSPRRNGNSDTLCDRFALGATEAGNGVPSAGRPLSPNPTGENTAPTAPDA